MVKSMNAQNVCDAKCQEKKRIEELRKTYIKAKQNAQNAQPNLDRAEQSYYTAAKGAAVPRRRHLHNKMSWSSC